MKIVHFPSTKLKTDTAEILNLVAYGATTVVIERHGEPIAKIIPANGGTDLEAKLKKHFGSIPDFPSVSNLRRFRKRMPQL